MKIYKEISLEDFEAWSGAVDTMDTLYNLKVETNTDVFSILEDCIDEFGDGMDEATVNDILWFETDTIAEWLGYRDWEQLEYVANGEDEEEIELVFAVGDIVNYNGEKGVIIEVDEKDKDLPYCVKTDSMNNMEKIIKQKICGEWCGIDELEAWEDEEE